MITSVLSFIDTYGLPLLGAAQIAIASAQGQGWHEPVWLSATMAGLLAFIAALKTTASQTKLTTAKLAAKGKA